jgi:hypothetical protein
MPVKNLNVIGGGGLIGNTSVDGLNMHNLELINFNSLKLQGNDVYINDIKYPGTDGAYGNVLVTDGQGNLQFVVPPSAPVTSVNTLTGDVVLDTDNISEGSTNLYYTDNRVDARISNASLGDLSDVTLGTPVTGNFLRFDGSNWIQKDLGGTNNYIVKYSSATDITKSVLYEATDGNVGVSDTSPSQKLSVKGGNLAVFDTTDRLIYVGKDTSNTLSFKFESASNKSIISSLGTNPVIDINVGSTTAMHIDKDGNVKTIKNIYAGLSNIGFKTSSGGTNNLISLKEYSTATNDVSIDTGGTLLIGSGDTASAYYDANSTTIKNDKILYLTSTNSIKLITGYNATTNTVEINSTGQIVSNVTNIAPFTISSTTLVTNLNSDYLDGKHASDFLQTNSEGTAGQTITFNEGLRTGFINFNQYDNYDPDDIVNTGGGAGIINDNSNYKALMILGNNSANGNKIIKLYDDVTISSDLSVTSNLSVGGTSALSGNVTMSGTLSVDSNTTIGGTLKLSNLTSTKIKMATINTAGEVGTADIPTIRKDLTGLTPIHFPYVVGSYTVNVTVSSVDSSTVSITAEVVPDNGSYTIYYGYGLSGTSYVHKKRTVSSTISQTQYINDTADRYSVMYVYADYGTGAGSGVDYGYSHTDVGEESFILATIKLRNAYNSAGEIIEIINWSKLYLNESTDNTRWETSTSGNGNAGDMVISNGSNKITTTSNVNWSDTNLQLKITGEAGMLALSYASNKAGSILGYNNNTEHWFIGRGDPALGDIHFGSITNDKVHIRANGANRMTITGSNKVGIGTTTPMSFVNNSGLHIRGDNYEHAMLMLGDPSISKGGIIQTSDSKHRIVIGANIYDDPTNSWSNFVSGKGGAGISVVADKNDWGVHISFFLSDNDNEYSQKMVLNSLGRLGIGSSAPTEKLHVESGNAKVEGHVQARDYVEVLDTGGAEGFKMQWNDTDKSIDFIIN